MKLLVFAHVPPPHHGQSYMVKLMLDGFGGDWRSHAGTGPASSPHGIECYHVDARLARSMDDIGGVRFQKAFQIFSYCAQAIWCRFRWGVRAFYFVPSPGGRKGLIRDWIVLSVCRPFFPRLVLHWHAAAMSDELQSRSPRVRAFTHRCLKRAAVSIVMSEFNRAVAAPFHPQRLRVVPNGIPDPCPRFDDELLPRRLARSAAQRKLLAGEALSAAEREAAGPDAGEVRVLFMAHCTREKGVFDTIEGVHLANEALAKRGSPLTIRLNLAGNTMNPGEREELERILATPRGREQLYYLGFAAGEAKDKALRRADLFCFPTYLPWENQPVNLIEAQAYGLPLVASRWRSVPEVLPPEYPALVEPRRPDQVAAAILKLIEASDPVAMRRHFLANFSLERHLSALATAIREADQTAG